MIFNELNRFDDHRHEAVVGVWSSALLLKQLVRKFFHGTKLASEAQFNVLLLLKYADKTYSQRELSERLLVDQSNITGLIDRLAQAGFLQRVADPQDRRTYKIELTELGRQTIDELEVPYRQEIIRITRNFSDDEIETLAKLMVKMQQAMEV